MKLSIVIPSYQDPAGLWFTVAACITDLEQDFAPDDYEIIAVVDGPDDDETRIILGMRQQQMCKFIKVDTRTPQKNRHIGLERAEGRHVFFLDSHVIVARGFFRRMLTSAQETGSALLHAGHCFFSKDTMAYGYNMDWKAQFWSTTAENKPKRSDGPYRIAVAGHGAICVDREQYVAIGGYWDALNGWGGEEPQLNLKAWLLGKEVWMEPRTYHWHYMPLKRCLEGMQLSIPYARNFFLAAYASGGQKYLDAVNHHFTAIHNRHATIEQAVKAPTLNPYGELYEEVMRDGQQERALICSGQYGGDLDALRAMFDREGIPH